MDVDGDAMRVAMVVQRYGPEIVGGAERLCRGVAEGLAARGHEVEVLTSCARSYVTWANAYPEGVESINGVMVRRFRTVRERDMGSFNSRSESLFGQPHSHQDEIDWVEAQGPHAPGIVDHVHQIAGDCDRLVFFTYLYHPTFHGIHAAPRKTVLVPTAHDEAPIYLSVYEPIFSLPAGLVFNTEAERAFVRRRFPRARSKSEVIGVGVDNLERLGAPIRAAVDTVDLGGEDTTATPTDGSPVGAAPDDTSRTPSVLYAGRIEAGKGVGELLDHLALYRGDTGRPVRLWLMGEVAMDLPEADWIEVLGFISEEEKIERMRSATVLAQPSALESFGIVALEAMAAGTPVLANAASEAVVEHCRRGSAGLFYRGHSDFHEALSLLLDDDRLRATLARNGTAYVRDNFSWSHVVERYETFLSKL
jgi:glycosyltransferase involved in cell wall biosynthesis